MLCCLNSNFNFRYLNYMMMEPHHDNFPLNLYPLVALYFINRGGDKGNNRGGDKGNKGGVYIIILD